MRLLVYLFLAVGISAAAAEPLRVCATVPDLGDLARAVGGDEVVVTVFARGGDDPHFVEARPSFSKALSKADVLVVVGLELEIGWVPILQEQARNVRILSGAPGYVDASTVIDKLGVPPPDADRGHGDVHAGGNPHYLSDPVCGVRVARLIADRLIALAPERRDRIEANWKTFAQRVAIALFGEQRGRTIDASDLVQQAERETTQPAADASANATAHDAATGGWFGAMSSVKNARVVADHDLWPYFARRFGLTVVGFMEPKPGISPTTRHLTTLIEQMREQHVTGILTAPFFDPQHARLVAERSGAVVIPLAHQVGSLADAPDYLATIDRNVHALVAGLPKAK